MDQDIIEDGGVTMGHQGFLFIAETGIVDLLIGYTIIGTAVIIGISVSVKNNAISPFSLTIVNAKRKLSFRRSSATEKS